MLVIDRRRASLYIAAREPAILVNGSALERLDAVVFRAGKAPSTFSLAIVRQLEIMGTFALNPADALARVGEPITLRQTLAGAGIAVPEVAVNPNDLVGPAGSAEHTLADSLGALGAGTIVRFAVCGGRVLGAIERAPASSLDRDPVWASTLRDGTEMAAARDLAVQAIRTLGLGLAAVDVALARTGPLIIDVTANVSLSQFERLTGVSLAEAVIVHIERAVEQWGLRRETAREG